MPSARMIGAAFWTLQPLYIVTEIVVGLQASADYSFADSTISDLGNTSCRTIRGDVLCSPWHSGMNVAFIYFGISLALGALLFLSREAPTRLGRAAAIVWCISGAGSIGVGLVPVNENGGLHGLVATPVFLAQPTALLLMGLALRADRVLLGRLTLGVAGLSTVGVLGFFVLVATNGSTGLGGLERVALWPGYAWVGVVAVSSLLGRNAQHRT